MTLYPIASTAFVVGMLLNGIVNLPNSLNTYLYTCHRKRLLPPYIDVNTYTNLYHTRLDTYDKYKRYIHVLHDNKLLHAHLLVDKTTGNMVYVLLYDNQYTVIEEDIEKYRLRSDCRTST